MWHQHAGRCSCKHKQSVREDQSSAGMYILLVYLPDVIEDGVAAGDGLKVARDLLAVRPDIMHPVVCDCVEGGVSPIRHVAHARVAPRASHPGKQSGCATLRSCARAWRASHHSCQPNQSSWRRC